MSTGFDPLPTTEVPPTLPTRYIAGFWRRVIAFIIDFALLCVVCFIVGGFLADYFHYHRRAAALVGSLIVVSYFALLGSAAGNGQTLGMKFLRIEVVDRQGEKLSLGRSFVRSLILIIPLTLGAEVLPRDVPLELSTAISYIQTAIFVLIPYFLIFNLATRQSLHDLLTGAFVTEKSFGGVVVSRPFWLGHWKLLGGILAAGLIVGFVFDHFFMTPSTTLGKLMNTLGAIRVMPNIDQVGVYSQTNWSNGRAITGIQVVVRYADRPVDLEVSGAKIADVVLRNDADAKNGSYIEIVSNEGFKIGFSALTSGRSVRHTPTEWQQVIATQSSSKNHP